MTSFGGLTFNQGAGWVPSDMAFAVGPTQVMQIVNGGFQVFSRSGLSLTGAQTDISFWNAAGISTAVTSAASIFDPRVLYDSGSGRFFVVEDVNNIPPGGGPDNQLLLAVSNTSNPMDGFKAVSFTATTGFTSGFADFPTLGLDQSGLYIGTNNFDNNSSATSISIFSIPKADLLLAGGPSLANGVVWAGMDPSTNGSVPHPAFDPGGSHGALLTLGPSTGTVDLFQISGASLSSPSLITGLSDGSIVQPLQQDGSVITPNIDNRYGATPVAVGNLLYTANMFGNGTTDLLHWMIVDLNTDTLLQQGTISDPNYFYTYPSIAANDSGDFVIGFNRSGFTGDNSGYIGAYAVGCHYDGTSVTCGNPLLEQAGQQLTFDGRWGDYSVTTADPTNPNVFWTAQDYVASDGTWATQITELSTAPEPATWALMAAGLGAVLLRRRASATSRGRSPR